MKVLRRLRLVLSRARTAVMPRRLTEQSGGKQVELSGRFDGSVAR